VKKGAGTLELAVGNHYTGGTVVEAGKLFVGAVGALPVGGALTIGAGATVALGSNLNQAAQQNAPVAGTLATAPAVTTSNTQQAVSTQGLGQPHEVVRGADIACAVRVAPAGSAAATAARQQVLAGPVGPSASSEPTKRVEDLSRKRQVQDRSIGPESPAGELSGSLMPAAGVNRLAWLWGVDPVGAKGKAGAKDRTLYWMWSDRRCG
jgi:autotransporter-associated beta strand protein